MTTGVVRHACRLRRDGTPPCGGAGEEVFGLGDSFAVGLGAVAGREVESCEG